MRIFTLPVGVLTDLKKGAPTLADALAKPLFYREDPELRIEREEYTDRPTTWRIVVESESVYEEVPIDANHYAAMKVAIGIHLVDLVKAIERDHAWIVAEMDVAGMVIELLRREREKAS